MAAASVWTRKAGGNDAVALLVTLITNGACFLYTPFWLKLFASGSIDAEGLEVLDPARLALDLVYKALLPILAGQLLRMIPFFARSADRFKTLLSNAAQAAILVIVFWASTAAGEQLAVNDSAPSGTATLLAWASTVVLHLAAMGVAHLGSRSLKFSNEDARAVLFAGSQKTLPIGVLIATGTFAALKFAVFPILMFHVSQLFIDTAIADRLALRERAD